MIPQAGTIRVFGAPESVLDLGDAGVLQGRPVLLNSDAPGIAASQYFVTDSLRRKLRNFGEIRVDYSQTLTASDPLSTFAAADDYLEPSWRPAESVAVYHGIASVTASSSAAGVGALPGQSATGSNPFAAVDGNPRTLWESGALTGPVHQWLRIGFDHAIDPGVIRVAFTDSGLIGPPVTKVIVQTAAGSVTDSVRATSKPQPLAAAARADRLAPDYRRGRLGGAVSAAGRAGRDQRYRRAGHDRHPDDHGAHGSAAGRRSAVRAAGQGPAAAIRLRADVAAMGVLPVPFRAYRGGVRIRRGVHQYGQPARRGCAGRRS